MKTCFSACCREHKWLTAPATADRSPTTSVLKFYFHLLLSMPGGGICTLLGAVGLMTPYQTGWNFFRTARESDPVYATHLSSPLIFQVSDLLAASGLLSPTPGLLPLYSSKIFTVLSLLGVCIAEHLNWTHQVNKSLPRSKTGNESKVNYWSLLWTSFLRSFVEVRHLENGSWKKSLEKRIC